MRKRAANRAIPDRPNFHRVDTARGPHVFRVPPLMLAVPLLEVASQGSEHSNAHRRNAAMLESAGAVIGATWYHPEYDLESPDYRDMDLREYGSLVVEELLASGWDLTDVTGLFDTIADQLLALVPKAPEVQRTADFTEPPAAS